LSSSGIKWHLTEHPANLSPSHQQTLLMDTFVSTTKAARAATPQQGSEGTDTAAAIWRVHFHAFMKHIHQRLHALVGRGIQCFLLQFPNKAFSTIK